MKTSKDLHLVIVGRPNVGKSTLFNRLLGRRRALVHDEPGVTRDRLEEKAKWWVGGKEITVTLVDTGGLGGDRFAQEIEHQAQIALDEADVVVVLFDAQSGYTQQDQEIVRKLQISGILKKVPVIGVVNKVDAEVHETLINEFYAAGLDPLLTVSAEHGRGADDLKDMVVQLAAPAPESAPVADQSEEAENRTGAGADTGADTDTDSDSVFPKTPKIPKIAILGKPNVGKSTLVNALLNEDRMITSPIAGTTVDSVDSVTEIDGKPFIIIDTAGIRRKSKTEQGVEVLSVVQARKALERADVAVLLLDGEIGTTDQDEKIGGLIEEIGCPVILALNKWDTQEGKTKFTKEMAAERVRKTMAYLRFAPIVFTSGKFSEGLDGLGDLIEEILKQQQVKISTREFTEWVRNEAPIHNPMNAKFYLCHQSGRHPPTFVCHVNDPKKIHFSLQRHLVNAMRERWGFMGSPIRLLFVQSQGAKDRGWPSTT